MNEYNNGLKTAVKCGDLSSENALKQLRQRSAQSGYDSPKLEHWLQSRHANVRKRFLKK